MAAAPALLPHDKCLLTELEDGTGVLLHLETKFYYTLNSTGVAVWKALGSGAASEREVAEKISHEFEVEVAQAESDARAVLEMMLSEGLVRRAR